MNGPTSIGLCALAPIFLAACRVARPSDIPRDEAWILAVKSCRCPDGEPAITHFAHHTWFDLKLGDEDHWVRLEVADETSGVRETTLVSEETRQDLRFGNREVRLLALQVGEEARGRIKPLRAVARDLSRRYEEDYVAWPGPNSNTFMTEAARRVDGLAFPMHHNAVSKDFAWLLDVAATTSKTGVRIDTLPLGFAVGVEEGVELHVLQLTLGVSLWPPRLKLPFLPEIPWSDDVTHTGHERTITQRTLVDLPGATTRLESTADPAGGILRVGLAEGTPFLVLDYARLETGEYAVEVRAFDGARMEVARDKVARDGARVRLFSGRLGTRALEIQLEQRERDLILTLETRDST